MGKTNSESKIKTSPQKTETAVSFEKKLEELENIVQQLEDGEKTLDESLELYEKGISALKSCHQVINSAEQRIKRLVKDSQGRPYLEDLDIPEEKIDKDE